MPISLYDIDQAELKLKMARKRVSDSYEGPPSFFDGVRFAERVLATQAQSDGTAPTEAAAMAATVPTDAELTAIYEHANGLTKGKAQPITTQRIFAAMRAMLEYKAPVADQPAEPSPAGLSDELRSFIEGMSVSVDVSTGDDDAGHRYFGTVTEVMDDLHDKHRVTLLVQDAAPNFKAAGFTLIHRATGKEHRTIPPGGHLVLDSWEERECDVRLAAPKGDSNG